VYNLIRAVAPPYPGAFTELDGRRLIVAEARRLSNGALTQPQPPGLAVAGGRIVGVCGDGGLIDIRCLLDDGRSLDSATLAGWLNSSGPQ
jgi:methionyl-tRNA formyltransferase